MYLIQENEVKEHDYVTYARQFDSYRWFKPVLTMFFFVVFYAFLAAVLVAASGAVDFMVTGGDWQSFLDRFSGGYESIDIKDPIGSLVGLGSVAIMIPAFWFARGIVRERPYSSYSSSRGGWGWWIFIKCLLISLVICALPIFLYDYYAGNGSFHNQFAKYGLIFLVVLCPLQCIAEEYVFRALINQALGAWFRIPIVAILISSIGFAALHPYNNIGRFTVFISGLCFGLCSWFGRGLEVSSALHIANNMTSLILTGFSSSEITSEIDIKSAALSIAIHAAYTLVIYLLSIGTDWFDRAKFDDAQSHNDMLEAKRKKKAAAKAARKAKREEKKAARQ